MNRIKTKNLRITAGFGGLDAHQLKAAREECQKQKIPLHKCIYSLGFMDEAAFLETAADAIGIEFKQSISPAVDTDIYKLISPRIASHYHIVPLSRDNQNLLLASSDPFCYSRQKEIELVLNNGYQVDFALTLTESIEKVIRKAYGLGAATVQQMTNGRNLEDKTADDHDLSKNETQKDASVIKLVNQILVDAITAKATDIHLEPYKNELKVKYRIDGMLHNAGIDSDIKYFKDGLCSRIKIMSGLDIAEKRLPQDGKTQVNIGGSKYDLRISILPTRHGEAINIRILPQSRLIMDLESLGMSKETVTTLKSLITNPHGIILVTGPTGSGKTTTLYTCMHMVKDTDRKIITIEDPIEYDMPGIVQMQAHPGIGFTFARALRSMLRHDPDIMLVGEIRDLETAQTAIRTSLTGHLVFSTLHTNDAASAITRLLDMGIEPFLAASSIDAILAQRLVRVICPFCKEQYQPEPQTLAAINAIENIETIENFFHGRGCAKCRFTGFHSRTVITELIVLSEKIRKMTIERNHSSSINTQARSEGMKSLFQSGIEKVKQGITTYQEVLRVTKGMATSE